MQVITLVPGWRSVVAKEFTKASGHLGVDYRLVAVSAAVGVVARLAVTAIWEPVERDAPTATGLEAGGSPILGDPAAPLTMIEWGNYQCTFCYRFH